MVTKPSIKKTPDDQALFMHEMAMLNDPRARVLDFGAGGGSFDYRTVKAMVVGIDQTVPRDVGRQLQGGYFVHGNILWLPFAADAFDLVVANFVFEHLWTPNLMLLEVQRVLKPEGLFYLSIPNAASLEDRLYRLVNPGDHLQRYSFHSFLKIVYQTTSFKLLAFADWPAGYTWLNPPPRDYSLREILGRLLRVVRPALQRRTRKDSGFICIFRKDQKLGFRFVTHICAKCGGGVTIEKEDPDGWLCPACTHHNR